MIVHKVNGNNDHLSSQPLALIGRQSIYSPDRDVFGYELLYRSTPGVNYAPSQLDGDLATTEVMLNTFLEIGIDKIAANKQAFINLTSNFINGSINIPISHKNVVLEILETVEPNEQILLGLKHLKGDGFTLALDDFDFNARSTPLLEFVDIVKVDLTLLSKESLPSKVNLIKQHYPIKLLAEKVESLEDFEFCKSLGFDLFQGYFLEKPVIISGKKMPANKLAILQLLGKLQNPDIEISELETLIKNDAALSFKILRYINSPAFGLHTTISSIKQAVVLLGLNTLKRWVSMIVIAGVCDKSQDLVRTSLIRAKMCELLASEFGLQTTDEYFLLGLFSLLDAMLDQRMEDILKSIPLNAELKQALINGEGQRGEILSNVKQYERGQWNNLIDNPDLSNIYRSKYLDAIEWAEATLSGMAS